MNSMIYLIRKFTKPFTCIAFVLFGKNVNAQIVSVQQIIGKLENHKNFSYQSVNRMREIFAKDTVTTQTHTVLEKAPEDRSFGYLFNMETKNGNDQFTNIDLYNGQDLIHITPKDSTYRKDKLEYIVQRTLPGYLRWMQGRIAKGLSKVVKTSDTTINAVDNYHLIVNIRDTLINKEHDYSYVHLYIDKLSGMPNYIVARSRDMSFGDGATIYYSETRYFDYQFDQNNIDIASMTIPKDFHPPKDQPALLKEQTDLLALGSAAPGWTLYTADGKKMSLTQLKGKVVLMDFYFIGCAGCMLSLKPLNNLFEKYKGKNFVIASITERDSKQSVLDFEKNYHLRYPSYVNAADVVKSYHVNSFPTFYYIDKEGKIANVHVGYGDDFVEKASVIIDDLLNK
ncbi:TlpA family protein disulfide reductase [Mucilaginibacter sp. NFX135]|uniref:TlpA family protein disulfide reductase n=1 Tax=Mucilaginibacter sp. NFX135 TaxID=3402687 RepID=UPI003AFACF5E